MRNIALSCFYLVEAIFLNVFMFIINSINKVKRYKKNEK